MKISSGRLRAWMCAGVLGLSALVASGDSASAGGIDYTLTCGITTANWGVRGYQASNDNSCQAVQSRVKIVINGVTTTFVGAPAVWLSQVTNTVGVRTGGGGRGQHNGGWGVWVP